MGVVHQPALLDGQYFVECPGDVEANAVHVVILESGCNLLFGQPALVGTAKLKFVAILRCLGRAEDGAELGQFNLPNPRQLVENLLLLEPQLLLVRQVLPLASATYAEMLAHGLCAQLTVFHKPSHLCFAVIVLLFLYLEVNNVARNGERHEHDKVVDSGHRLAFGCHIGDGDIFKYWEWFFLSAHLNLCFGVQSYKFWATFAPCAGQKSKIFMPPCAAATGFSTRWPAGGTGAQCTYISVLMPLRVI